MFPRNQNSHSMKKKSGEKFNVKKEVLQRGTRGQPSMQTREGHLGGALSLFVYILQL